MSTHKHPAAPALMATFALFLALFLAETTISDRGVTVRMGNIVYGYASSGRVHPVTPEPKSSSSVKSSSSSSAPVILSSSGPTCGNAVIDKGEECDLGVKNNGVVGDRFTRSGGCMKNCRISACGDGILQLDIGEECEPLYETVEKEDPETGETVETKEPFVPACGEYCAHPVVDERTKSVSGCFWTRKMCPGDLPQITEEGFLKYAQKMNGSASSQRSSVFAQDSASSKKNDVTLCGNGSLDPGEACDQGRRNASDIPNACRPNCQVPECGDGVIDALYGEACDRGRENSNTAPNACRLSCTPAICGDNVVDEGEACDGGEGCTTSCTAETPELVCADGDESCRTTQAHQDAAGCGNGTTEPGEACDDGNVTPGDGCSESCASESETCGNGVVENEEECDDGAENSNDQPDRCRADCRRARCGDGTLDATEECDDGNVEDRGDCTAACVLPACGDGGLQAYEQCDDEIGRAH